MTEDNREFNVEVNEKGYFEALSELYCEVYAGPPWHQKFEPEDISNWLKSLPSDGSLYTEVSYDESNNPMAFCIARIDTPQRIIPEYINNYKQILSTDTEGILPIGQDLLEQHCIQLEKKLLENPKLESQEKILYLMDIGIRPDLQRTFKGPKSTIEMLYKLFENATAKKCKVGLAQTLTEGPMIEIVKRKVQYEELDLYPVDSLNKHITFLFTPDLNVFKK